MSDELPPEFTAGMQFGAELRRLIDSYQSREQLDDLEMAVLLMSCAATQAGIVIHARADFPSDEYETYRGLMSGTLQALFSALNGPTLR